MLLYEALLSLTVMQSERPLQFSDSDAVATRYVTGPLLTYHLIPPEPDYYKESLIHPSKRLAIAIPPREPDASVPLWDVGP
jgi:hypothetical protein